LCCCNQHSEFAANWLSHLILLYITNSTDLVHMELKYALEIIMVVHCEYILLLVLRTCEKLFISANYFACIFINLMSAVKMLLQLWGHVS